MLFLPSDSGCGVPIPINREDYRTTLAHFTYIIQSIKDDNWYYGYSKNPQKRLTYHNNHQSWYTKSKQPWHIIFIRKFESKADALKFERYLKKTKNKEYIKREFSKFFIRDVAQYG